MSDDLPPEFTVKSNKSGRLKKKEAEKALEAEDSPQYSKDKGWDVIEYTDSKGYTYYKLGIKRYRKRNKLKKEDDLTYKKVLCVCNAWYDKDTTNKYNDSEIKVYCIHSAKDIEKDMLESLAVEITSKLTILFTSAKFSFDGKACGETNIIENKVIVNFNYENKRSYVFRADLKHLGGRKFKVSNQKADKGSEEVSGNNPITGEYDV